MSIARKVEIIFGIILVLLCFSFLYVNYYLNIMVKDMRLFTIADNMSEDILQVRRHEKNFILRGEPLYADLTRNYLSDFLSGTAEYRKSAYRKTDLERLDELLAQFKIYQQAFNQYAENYKSSKDRPESPILITSGRNILSSCEVLKYESSYSIMQYLNNIVGGKFILLLLFVLMSLSALWFTYSTIVSPIKKLQQLCQTAGRQALLDSAGLRLVDNVLKDINSRDEIGELARAYREMLIRHNNAALSLQQKMKEIEAIYNLKSSFTSMVSHELRTPLAPIKEGIELVLDGSAGKINNEQKEFLEIAKRNVDRLTHLINDVLDFSKLSAKKVELNLENSSINEIIESVVTIYKLVIEKKGLYIVTELQATRTILMRLDPDRINQVLTNLIANAVKFSDRGGITIKTSLEDNSRFVRVSVTDTGIGIRKEDICRLFQPFIQVSNGSTRKIGGTGLGLAICKEIVEQSGGRIWVDSEFGKGSTFSFILPRQNA